MNSLEMDKGLRKKDYKCDKNWQPIDGKLYESGKKSASQLGRGRAAHVSLRAHACAPVILPIKAGNFHSLPSFSRCLTTVQVRIFSGFLSRTLLKREA